MGDVTFHSKNFVTVAQAAEILGLKPSYVARLARDGTLGDRHWLSGIAGVGAYLLSRDFVENENAARRKADH